MTKISLQVRCNRGSKFKVRNYRRCNKCGRARAHIRKFQLCRICFRELASIGQIPGVTKASW